MKANELKSFLTRAKKVAGKKSSLPASDCAFITGGELKVFSITNTYEVYTFKHEIFNGFSVVVDFANFIKIITKLKKNEIELTSVDEMLHIKAGKNIFKVSGKCADFSDMLDRVEYEDEPMCELTDDTIKLIKKAMNFRANDELRPVMNNVLLDAGGFVVASDANRLCYYKSQKFDVDILINSVLIDRMAKIYMSADSKSNWVKIDMGDEILEFEEADGKFPDWRSVIPACQEIETTIRTADFIDKIDMCMTVANSESFLGVMDLGVDKSTVSASDIDFDNHFESDFSTSNIPIKVGFKLPLMRGLLLSVDEEYSTIKFQDESHAMVINDNMLLMPMMINQ